MSAGAPALLAELEEARSRREGLGRQLEEARDEIARVIRRGEAEGLPLDLLLRIGGTPRRAYAARCERLGLTAPAAP